MKGSRSLQSITLHYGGFLVYEYLASSVTTIKNTMLCFHAHVWIISLCLSEELSAAFFPGATETWAPHPLAAYPELAAPTAALHHHALIQHPALAQVPVRVSRHLLYLLPHMCKTLVKRNTTAVTVVTCVEVLHINHNHHGNLLFHMGLLHSNTVTMVTCSSHGSVA